MNVKEFDLTIKAFIDEIVYAREKRDFELLDSLSSDLRDYLGVNAYLYKGLSKYCNRVPKGFLSRNRDLVRDRAQGRCEIRGEKGTQTHHLCGRGSLMVYHLPELLIHLCCKCHRRFHEGG